MNNRISVGILIGLCLLILTGCSGDGSNPALPATGLALTSGPDDQAREGQQSRPHLIGYYDVLLDLENHGFELVPNRSIDFALNLMVFLNNPTGLSFNVNDVFSAPDYVDIDIDITLNHPLDDAMFDIYDVRAIFMGDGTEAMSYDSDLIYGGAGTHQGLINADGYSRWFNPTGFYGGTLFDYVPNFLSTPDYTTSATLNPYKYYSEGLGADDDLWTYLAAGDPETGYFLHGSSLTRNFLIRFPIPVPGIKYAFAIIANWEGTDPGNHPSHAYEAVGVSLEDFSTLYYVDEINNGGNLDLDITVFDWDAELTGDVMLDYDLFIESTVLYSDYKVNPGAMVPTASGDNWNTFHFEIPADAVLSTVGNELWIIVEDNFADYTNPAGFPNEADDDPIAACFRYDLLVTDEPPPPPDPWIMVTDPNGDEIWPVGFNGEITWDSFGPIDEVKIELSMDSGASYDYVLAATTPNDGIFEWNSIPVEFIGTQNRIKVSDVTDPLVFDESDADFTVTGEWLTVTSPNGGESWAGYSTQEITWGSSSPGGYVNIEYSKDNFTVDINEIVTTTPNDGSYFWDHVALDFTDTARVRIYSADPPVADTSDADFSITEPGALIDVLLPDGGEEWGNGSSNGITWFSYGDIDRIGISYSTDNFTSVITTVATDLDDTGSYDWTVPYDPTTTARVMVEGYALTTVVAEDVSIADFSIVDGGWVRTWKIEDYYNVSYDVVSDDEGYVYVCGYADDDYSSWPVTIKYDPAGNLMWMKEFGESGSSYDWNGAYGIELDSSGNIYQCGGFEGTNVDFDPGPGMVLLSSGAERNGFLCKWDSGGNFLWAITWGGTDYGGGSALAIDSSKVWVIGTFRGTWDFDPGGGVDSHMSNGEHDSYLTAFDHSGIHQWAGTWGGPTYDSASDLAVDGNGTAYVVGYFMGTDIDFDPSGSTFYLTSNGSADPYVTCIDTDFAFVKAVSWGSANWDRAEGITILSPYNDPYVTGYFDGDNVDFDPGVGEDLHTTNGDEDVFLTMFDQSLNHVWSSTFGGEDEEEAYWCSVDGNGRIAVGGYYESDTVDFDPGPGTDIHYNPLDNYTGFYCVFEEDGTYLRAHTFTTGEMETYNGFMSDSGIVYICGDFETPLDFAPTFAPCNSLPDVRYPLAQDDGFIAKYMPDGCW